MRVKISVLVDNVALSPQFGAMHGLSFHVETASRRILFDLGDGTLFEENATRLGIDLEAVDTVVISHGHKDHGGALGRFLEINSRATVCLDRHAFEEHFSVSERGARPIGLDLSLQDNTRIVHADGDMDLGDGIFIFSSVTGKEMLPESNSNLHVSESGKLVRDDFRHEQNMILTLPPDIPEENGGKPLHLLFGGCAHRGIVNIMARASEIIGRAPDYCISGFHLSSRTGGAVSEEYIAALADRLMGFGNTLYMTCHCTGTEAYSSLKTIMGPRLEYVGAGKMMCLSTALLV